MPGAWLLVVLGVVLGAEPGAANLSDAWRCAIADGAYRDLIVRQRCDAPGFSAAVIAHVAGEARLQGALRDQYLLGDVGCHLKASRRVQAGVCYGGGFVAPFACAAS